MYGYLEYQQQLLGEIYANYVPPLTPADHFLNRLSRTPCFSRLKKKNSISGEFSYKNGLAYLAIQKADFLRTTGCEYLILLKTIWIPQENRRQGILFELVSDLMKVVRERSACSVFASSQPFEFAEGFDPLVDPMPAHSNVTRSRCPKIAVAINSALARSGFREIDQDALWRTQHWENREPFVNSESKHFAFHSNKSTWMLNSFFKEIFVKTE